MVPPTSRWDDRSRVVPDMCYNTFGSTPTEAWLKHMQVREWDALRANHWINRGYRLRRATLTIEDDEDAQVPQEASGD